jgi:ABC-type sugar transport system substrate-binding protein
MKQKNMKRGLAFLALVTAGSIAMTGCAGGSNADASRPTVGVSLNSLQFPFIVTMNNTMKDEAQSQGVNLVTLDSRNNVSTELSQIEDLIQRKPKAIVMDAVDTTSSQAAAKKVNAAGIPLITVDNTFPASSGIDVKSYIGVDGEKSGQLQAEYLNKALPQGGDIIYLVGVYGAPWTDQRKAGFDKAVGANIHVATETQAQGSRANGKSVMEDLLRRYSTPGQIKAIVAQNDEMALGAISAIQDSGRMAEFPLIIGVDGSDPGLQAIKDGTLSMSVKQDPRAEGKTAISVAKKVASGEGVDPQYLIPYTVVTKDNVGDYLSK